MDAVRKLKEIGALFSLPSLASRRQKEQWLPAADLHALRSRRIQSVLEQARAAPYYQRILSDRPSGGAAAGDPLAGIPLLTKGIIAENGVEALFTAGNKGLLSLCTSGSTGRPTRFYRSPLEEAEFSARWFRIYAAYGGSARDSLLNVGRPDARPRSGPVKVMRDLGLLPKVRNASVTAPIEESVRIVEELKPRFVTGYSIGIENIAEHIVNENIEIDSVKAALCGAMDVSDRCRELVKKAFDAPAVDVYVSIEFGVIGWECPVQRGSLHINDDMLVMEILDNEGNPVPDGTMGEVVLTSLTLKRMPLLRYRTGDTAARMSEPCPCGRGLGVMTKVQGRTSHSILGPQGQMINAPVISAVVTQTDSDQWVRRFQLREQKNHVLTLLVEPLHEPLGPQVEVLRAGLAKAAGPGFKIDVEMRPELPLAPTGKYQYVVPLPRAAAAMQLQGEPAEAL